MKKNWDKKIDKIVILSAAIIVATLTMALLFIYMPFLDRNKSLRAEILKERDRNILVGKIRAFDKHLKVYEKGIQKGRDVSWLIGRVSDMATKEGIEISSMKPDPSKDSGLCTELYVVLDIVSTYDKVGKFISRIESQKEFLKIESINIKKSDLDDKPDKKSVKVQSFDINGHIVISTIVFKE